MQEHSSDHRPAADEGETIATFNALRDQIAALDRRNTEGMANLQSQVADSDRRTITRLDRIEGQTSKTNGRVTKLELRNAFLSGGLALLALGFAGGITWIGIFK